MTGELRLAWRLAWRELRGGLRGFRVFVACLVLGVGAIAGVGSVSQAMLAGIDRDARLLLGGDVDFRLVHRAASAEERAYLETAGRVSETLEMRAMAGRPDGGERALVELKSVDDAYPLVGRVRLAPEMTLEAALAPRDGIHGAVAEAALLDRLGLSPGDRLRLGEATIELRATIQHEPDRAVGFAVFGPRLMVADAALPATGLVQEGSLIRYHYRLLLPPGADGKAFIEQAERDLPKAGWRISGLDRAAPGFERFVGRVSQYLALVGLTALLVGGVGVATAVKAHLERRGPVIATLKCLGAPGGLVFRVYLLQVLAVAALGIAGGLAVGALAPGIAATLARGLLPVDVPVGLYPRSLAVAALFGLLTALAFTLWPLGKARDVPAGALFRAIVAPPEGLPRRRYIVAATAAVLALAALAVATTSDRALALWFVAGAVGAVLLFRGVAQLLVAGIVRLPRSRRPGLRLALANLARPGAPTGDVALSLGLGLTVLVTVALVEANISRQLAERIPDQAPAYFFIDIQPHQVARFDALAGAVPGVVRTERTPMVRGRVAAIAGVPAEEASVAPDVQWTVRGDRGFTYEAAMPAGTELVAGEWWPEDYRGPPLVSVDAEVARGYGVGLGDKLVFNILGREIEATIASLRRIDWSTFAMNFVFVFAPGTLEAAPHSVIATVYVEDAAAERAVQRRVTDAFPNVSAIRIKDALDAATRILEAAAVAVRLTASVTLVAGTLVLAGAVAAGHQRRIYDAVVLKVLGATRRRVLSAYGLEYGLLGLIAAALAALVGSIAAGLIVTRIMRTDFLLAPEVVALTAVLAAVITLAFGLFGTWRALGQKAAPLLRNE